MEQATAQLKDWQEKLDAFNKKVPQPSTQAVEIIQKKTEDKEIVAENTDGFDPDEVKYDMETKRPDPADVLREIEKEKQEEEFKKREQQEKEALEEVARKAREEESQRIKPDLTEVIEPEKPKKESMGMIGQRIVEKGKVVSPPKPLTPAGLSDFERTGLLNKFHQEHGKFEDISDEALKMERDESNRAQFLADVSLTKEQAEAHPPITESRMAYFQDIIDDILRGNTTYENVPEELKNTLAQLMDPNLDNPDIITKGSALKVTNPEGIEEMSAEGLKEKFMISPQTEERPMTEEELDSLLDGWNEEQKPSGKTKMVIQNGKKIFVPVENKYKQNEEQDETTIWNKTKELDLPEPEKNEIILPALENTVEKVPEMVEELQFENVIPQDKFTNYKKRLTTDEDYRQRVENRINDLITKIENKEIKLNDLTKEDQQVIMDILNQNG
jgi:hypothetical protein